MNFLVTKKERFTGANQRRLGRFETAHTGSLLLDEVTEISLNLQCKLLRVIQEREFERVGGNKTVKSDVRIISTSNRNMEEAIRDNIFREDLYYRLNVIPIHLPPLRERRDDIIPLAEYFLKRFYLENHKDKKIFSKSARQALLDYHWPGNIRELANVIERSVVMDYSQEISAQELGLGTNIIKPLINIRDSAQQLPVGITIHELEKRLIIETLHAQQENRTKTAEVLGISIRTLRNKLHEYNYSSKKGSSND